MTTGEDLTSGLSIEGLTLEQAEEGSPLGTRRPRLSWRLRGDPGVAYELTTTEIEWTSGNVIRVHSSRDTRSILRAWPFRDLGSRENGSIRVRMGDGVENWTPWSPPVKYLIGLLEEDDWSASFITPRTFGRLDAPAPTLIREFDLSEDAVEARMWVSALGVYELRINGRRVGDDELAPGWTAYGHRLRYQAYDVAADLRLGRNRIEVTLGNGWYRGYLTWDMDRTNYGARLALIAQLEISFSSGTTFQVDTDASWSALQSQIASDDLYNGERHEAADFRYLSEDQVTVLEFPKSRLVARRGPAVRVTETVSAKKIFRSASGKMLVDFGQNLVGRVRLTARDATPGSEVTVVHAEVLEEGELALRPLGHAEATCTYALRNEAEQTLVPKFTFSGFRYIQVDGLPDLQLDDVVAEVLGSDLRRTGWFECSDPALNQLHRNVVWGARGNFLDLPTDCPQRAERLGWTGDIQVFAPTANFLFDTSGFLAGWLEDLLVEQLEDGSVPWVVPNVYPGDWAAEAGWGDAATVVPLSLHDTFADDDMLERQFASMCRWVDKIASLADDRGVWFAAGKIGDWLDPDAPPEEPGAAKADPAVIATAYFVRSARLVSEAARRLGRPGEQARYADLAHRATAGFMQEFVEADGRIRSDCQTVYALALAFGLIADEGQAAAAGRRLAELVELAEATVSTGFLGTPHILDALCIAGRADLAHRMLRQNRSPSWLYSVQMGATTIWERWDALLPDGRVHPGSMTSFNHYAYGAVADFMHRRIGGLRPLSPGYRRFAIEPVPGDLSFAALSFQSAAGTIELRWTRHPDLFELELTVPHGAEAEVLLPGQGTATTCGWGRHRLRSTAGQQLPGVTAIAATGTASGMGR